MKGTLPEEPQTPDTLVRNFLEEIDKAVRSGGFVSVLFHPFLTNKPERMQAMETIVLRLAQLRGEGQIWLARCGDIAEWLHAHPDTVGDDPKWDASSWR